VVQPSPMAEKTMSKLRLKTPQVEAKIASAAKVKTPDVGGSAQLGAGGAEGGECSISSE
jgi:hypothetical protein